jgi:NarL family two-component system response regulator LiaR
MEKIRFLIADDHVLFREGLRQLLEGEDDIECVALASDGKEAVRLTSELTPDVALIDISMPELDGIECVKQIKSVAPNTSVIMLSAYKYPHYVAESVKAGADGYLLKSTPRSELANAIRMVQGGEGVFGSGITKKALSRLSGNPRESFTTEDALCGRELEVLKLTAKGLTNKMIAKRLGISGYTVGTHLVNIFRKIGVKSRTEAALYAVKEGWLTLDDVA